jgi:TP901 family phage tail tape measure protein
MAKQINRNDIAEQDLFKNVRDSAINTLKTISKLNEEFKETARVLKNEISGAKIGNSAEIEKFVKATTKANKLKKESIELSKLEKTTTQTKVQAEKQLAKAKAEELKTERNLLKETRLLNTEKERATKAAEKQKKAIQDENNEYKKLVKVTRDQKNESKKLAAELLKLEANGGKNTKQWRKLSAEYRKTTKAAQKGDKALKKIDGTVGDNFRNVGNYKSALGGLTRVLSGLGLAFGGLSIVKGAGETIVNFDKSIQDLKAITGASGKDLEFFKEQAKSLGTQVEGGASSVIEAYKLIGSAKPELLKNAEALDAVTQSAITLSQASGLDLPEAATRLTDAMNQFGAPAEEAGKFINVLANGALFGSAAIPDVTDALLKFGAAANTSNVSLEESTALIEALASKGLKGAEAGTALRNVMLKLSAPDALPKEAQKSMAALGISFEDLKDTSKPFAERLDALKPLLNDNGALIKVFGKENSIAATNLLNMTGEVKELTKNMETQGTVQRQAAENTDTVAFAFNELKETWNKFILDLDQGAGIGEKIKNMLRFLSENLDSIVKALGFAIKAFITYKAIVKITAIQNRLLATSFGDIVKNTGGIKGAFGAMKTGINNVGKALKANAIGIAIAAIAWAFNGMRAEAEKLNAVLRKTDENQQEIKESTAEVEENLRKEKTEVKGLFDALAKTNSEGATRSALIDEINGKYGLTLENLEDEKDFNEQNALALAAVNAQLEKKAKLRGAEIKFELSQAQVAEAEIANRQAFEALKAAQNMSAGSKFLSLIFDKFGAVSEADLLEIKNASQDVLDNARKFASEYEKEYIDLQATFDDIDLTTPTPTPTPTGEGTPTGGTPTPEKFKSLIKEIEDAQIKQIKDDQKRQNLARAKTFERLVEKTRKEKTIKSEFDTWLKEQTKVLVQDLQKIDDDAEQKRQDARNKSTQALTQSLILEKEIELGKLDETVENEIKRAELQDQLDAMRIAQIAENAQIEIQKLGDKEGEKQKVLNESELAQDEILKAGEKRREELRTKQFDRQIKAYSDAEKEKYLELLKSDKTQKQIDKEMFEYQKAQLIERIAWLKKNYPKMTDLIRSEEIKLAEMQRQVDDKEDAALDEEKNKKIQQAAEIADAITTYYIKKADERIAKLNEEIDAAKKQSTFLQQLAAEGNINAQQSLAEQNRIIAEANRKKEQEEQRKQRAELVNAALQTYAAKAQDPNVENPLLETIRDIALLQQFIATIPAFLDGTEDTGTNGQGVDGKGGFNAILHPNERVMTKEQNAKVGNLSNANLAKVAQEYNAGKLVSANSAIQIGGAWESTAVLNELSSIQETIKNKPETNIRLEEIINGALMITRETKKGNSVVYNRYKTKA